MKCPSAVAGSLLLVIAPLLVAAQRGRREDRTPAVNGRATVLAQRIAELEAQVERLERQVRGVEAERDEFLATLSHELRSPLNAMLGWIELLRLQVDDPAHRDHAINVIERNARAQHRIIGELLDLARLVTHRVELAREPVRLDRVVASAVDEVRAAAAAKAILMEVDGADAVTITVDAAHVRQAVAHLLDNAVKFTPEGGRVTVTLAVDDASATVAVADTGIGIDRAMQRLVFERFRQVERGLTRQYTGLGLGLTIARHVAALHGGSLDVESQGRGAGARFTLRLPR